MDHLYITTSLKTSTTTTSTWHSKEIRQHCLQEWWQNWSWRSWENSFRHLEADYIQRDNLVQVERDIWYQHCYYQKVNRAPILKNRVNCASSNQLVPCIGYRLAKPASIKCYDDQDSTMGKITCHYGNNAEALVPQKLTVEACSFRNWCC